MSVPDQAPNVPETGAATAPAEAPAVQGGEQAAPAAQSPAAAAAARRAEVRARIVAGAHRGQGTQGAANAAAAPVAPEPKSTASVAPGAGDDPAAQATDPPAETGQALLRKQEQHLRRQLATERAAMQAEFDQQRSVWQQKTAKATELEQRLAGAGKDPIALLSLVQAAGYSDADFEGLAQLFYAHSPEGQKDPRRKDVARAALRDREQAGSVSALKQEIDDMRKQLSQRDQQAQVQAYLANYADTVAKAASDATPIAKAALGKNPQRAREQLLAVAARLYHESGPSDDLRDEPTPAEVLEAYEEERGRELELYGIDAKSIGGRPNAPPSSGKPAAVGAKPNGAATPQGAAKPKARLSRDELVAKIEENKKRVAAARNS